MPTKLPVDQYLNKDLFDELGLDTLSVDERMSFLEGFANVVQSRLTFRLMDELSAPQKERLDQVLTVSNSGEPVAAFLAEELPNFGKIAEEEIAKYKKELVERFKA